MMSSPRRDVDRVSVVPRKPLSVTSSTVSPMDNTKVALKKDTMMYASNFSENKVKSNTKIQKRIFIKSFKNYVT